MGDTISPEQVRRELADLWTSLGRQGDDKAGVLRACSMSLLVLAEESDDATHIGETLAALMPESPSRAVVIRVLPSAERITQARVSAQCWQPFGQTRQICCEQVEIQVSDSTLAEVSSLLAPILIPELPVILWCRSPRVFRMPAFQNVAQLAGKIVIDSAAFPDPPAILGQIAALAENGRYPGDLSWTRLTRWRELIAQIFENRAHLADLHKVAEVRIWFPDGKIPVSAWYLAAWLTEGIRTAGGAAQPVFQAAAQARTGPLHRVELASAGDPGVLASLALADENMAEVRAGSLVSRAEFCQASDSMLMREELSVAGRDPVYEKTLPIAAKLALSSST